MCLMHSEATQTETLEFGAEIAAYFRTMQGEWVAHAPKNPKLPDGFLQSIFKGKVRKGVQGMWST